MVNAIIMASGFSKRMGENKLLLDYKGISIIEHVFKEVSKSNFKEVTLVSQYKEVLKIGKEYNFKCIKNNNADIGQSESIKLGIKNSSNCDGYMFFVGDQPKIRSEMINMLINKFEENKDKIVIPKSNNRTGNPVIFPYNKKEELLLLKNDEKGKKIINNSSEIIYLEVDEELLFDIDTKKDYERLRGEQK